MPLRTIVVGGGIGGLSLARELAKLGLPAVVLERAPKLATVGAGIIMNPNAMSVLEANGLAACVRSRSAPYLARDTSDHRGRWLATRDYRPLYADGRLAVGALLHRSHLHDCLYDGLPPGTVHLDTRIRDLEAGLDGVRVETERGEVYTGDLLVGADGIRSTVRARFFGQHDPVYLGYRSHRFVVANRDGLEHFTEFLGRGQRVGLVPIGGGQLYVWTTFNSPVESRAWALESVGALQALFGRFTDARVRRAFAELPSTESVVCTDIEEVRQETWARGRVALLGDAAFCGSPLSGMGTSAAIVGGYVLAGELAAAGGDHRVAFPRYQNGLRDYVKQCQKLQIGRAHV